VKVNVKESIPTIFTIPYLLHAGNLNKIEIYFLKKLFFHMITIYHYFFVFPIFLKYFLVLP